MYFFLWCYFLSLQKYIIYSSCIIRQYIWKRTAGKYFETLNTIFNLLIKSSIDKILLRWAFIGFIFKKMVSWFYVLKISLHIWKSVFFLCVCVYIYQYMKSKYVPGTERSHIWGHHKILVLSACKPVFLPSPSIYVIENGSGARVFLVLTELYRNVEFE